MSLVDKLMAIDKGSFAIDKTEQVPAKHLSEVLGEQVEVTIKALTGDQYTDITTRLMDRKGNMDFSRTYDINALLVVAAVVDPVLSDKDLQKHFGAATPKDLAKILFPGAELTALANRITELSGFTGEDEETAEVKN